MTDTRAFFENISADRRTLEMFRFLNNNAFIRVVNYHNTNPAYQKRYEEEIAFYARHYAPVTVADLDRFFDTHVWPYDRPGLIPAVFEGFRSQYDVMLPLLNRYGFTGWFYIPSFYMDVPVPEQLSFSQAHELDLSDTTVYPDGRFAMNWDEVREVAKNHEVCCHTGTHFQITEQTAPEDMRREIVDAKRHLEEKIQKPVDVFCWLYGEEYRFNRAAHPYLKEAGYKYVLSNMKLERIG